MKNASSFPDVPHRGGGVQIHPIGTDSHFGAHGNPLGNFNTQATHGNVQAPTHDIILAARLGPRYEDYADVAKARIFTLLLLWVRAMLSGICHINLSKTDGLNLPSILDFVVGRTSPTRSSVGS